ncbi:MAG: hypothetical protein ACTHK4_02480 [Mycobacteriales bacterium]
MPRACLVDERLPGLIAQQDYLVRRNQLLAAGFSRNALEHRVGTGQWFAVLPEVYLTHPGTPTRRQLMVAALLYAGPQAAIDGPDACRFHGVRAVAVDESKVHVVAPFGVEVRSRQFVVVRRTLAEIRPVVTDRLRYVDPATAVVAAGRRMRDGRAVLAAFSDAVQRRITTYDELVRAHVEGPPRNSRAADAALAAVGAGIRSAPEEDFRRLTSASLVLPPAEYNAWLQLPSGRRVCVDALFASSALVHETNGRRAHAREDLFEDMQERHDALTASGFTVLHNSPRRLREHPREVIAQVERCHQLYGGRGLPTGVRLLRGDS